MNLWIALIRGINVGGHNILPMKDLRAQLKRAGYQNVRTYIQSGNCVLEAEATEASDIETGIASIIEDEFGFRPNVMAFTATEFAAALALNPFPTRKFDPKNTHVFFLASSPTAPDFNTMNRDLQPGEAFELTEHLFFLRASNGLGRSKIAARIERLLGVSATARNLNTVQKICEMTDS